MELKLKRRFFAETYTIGSLYINDAYLCDTIEDKNRDTNHDGDLKDTGEAKVWGKTAIPFGKYEIILNMSPKMKRMLPRLLNVPEFDGVLIHRGNTAEDSAGCIIVGENKVKGKVINSTGYENALVMACSEAIKRGEKIIIEIV